jgi:hypothetical protein
MVEFIATLPLPVGRGVPMVWEPGLESSMEYGPPGWNMPGNWKGINSNRGDGILNWGRNFKEKLILPSQ